MESPKKMFQTSVSTAALSLAAVFGTLSGWSSSAQAALGQPVVRLSTSGVASAWSFQHQTLETGTRVREFFTAEGTVFAVTWQGPVLPDLTILLGTYFSQYAQAAQRARTVGRAAGPLQMNATNLVLQSRGRMRDFSGFAYLPALLPIGFNTDALQP